MNEPNPFTSKRSKSSRFSKDNFFTDDEIKSKEKIKNTEHSQPSSNINTFLIDNSKNNRSVNINSSQKPHDRGRNNERKQYREQSFNSFSSQSNNNNKPQVLEFNIITEEFPELTYTLNTTSICDDQSQSKNFLDAINTVNIVEEVDDDKIKPGWIVICKDKDKDNNQIKITQGQHTEYQLKVKEKEALMDNPNYIMEEIHQELLKLWDKNVALYDSIHGEGAYEEVYYLPPVYDDFYKYEDSDNEDDDNFDGNEQDEYSDWISDYE